jgi:1-phosphatidylinositol phosphodiesterase
MNKKYLPLIASSAISVIAIVSSFLAFLPSVKSQGTVQSQTWMSSLKDEASLTEISIPGSHDSGATKSLADIAGVCQDSSISDQLNNGVRYLDIRLGAYKDYLTVYHGSINQDLSFTQVLETTTSFLKAHPTELILLSVKEEKKPDKSSLSFETLLKQSVQSYFSFFYTERALPKLGAARGKMVLLSRYENNTIGIDSYQGWSDSADPTASNTFDMDNGVSFKIQDHYKLKTVQAKEDEFSALLSLSDAYYTYFTANPTTAEETFYLNFASGYLVNSFPPSYSVSAAKKINPWLLNTLSSHTCTGVVIMDFVTPELASAVYTRNSL